MTVLLVMILVSFTNGSNQISTDPDTGLAMYKEVISVPGLKAGDLYDRGIKWVNKFYVNPTGVLQKQDKEGGLIDGKARFKLKVPDKKGNLQNTGGFVAYQIAMEFKDEKFRYIVDHIRWEQNSYYDVTKWSDSTQTNYDKLVFNSYIDQTAEYFEKLTSELATYMKVGEPVKKDDW